MPAPNTITTSSGLTNAQAHALQKIRDAVPGAAHTVNVLLKDVAAAWHGHPNGSDLAAEVHARLDRVAAALAEIEQVVRPYADQTPIEELGLPVRAMTALRDREGIRTVAQLSTWPEVELADIPGIGQVLLRQIKGKLRQRGIALPPNPF